MQNVTHFLCQRTSLLSFNNPWASLRSISVMATTLKHETCTTTDEFLKHPSHQHHRVMCTEEYWAGNQTSDCSYRICPKWLHDLQHKVIKTTQDTQLNFNFNSTKNYLLACIHPKYYMGYIYVKNDSLIICNPI